MEMEIDEFASHEPETSIAKKFKHSEEPMSNDGENSTGVAGSTFGSLKSDILKSSNSDLSNDDDIDGDEVSDYSNNDNCMYDEDDSDEDYLRMQTPFDNIDLPPGVEASVSWLKDLSPSANVSGTSQSLFPDLSKHKDTTPSASSSSTLVVELTSDGQERETSKDEVLRKFQLFKQFDTVNDFSDHHFSGLRFSWHKPPKGWAKKIQAEWKILKKGLPSTIYVRVYETRMDLLRAVITGPAGTPYHDGLFVFDVLFPPTYPDIPPKVYFYSGGLRLNPNLYEKGKVCLSLLNTYTGEKNEMWMPKKSTMLQVLVSIQALILNHKPCFNEPGFETLCGSPEGERWSKAYNEEVLILSLKTMIYTLLRPPKHFEDFVAGHFRVQAHNILSALKVYMEGALVGSTGKERVRDEVNAGGSDEFKEAVAKTINGLVTNFIKNGSEDCKQFRIPGY